MVSTQLDAAGMAAATCLPEPFFQLCLDAGYIKACDAGSFLDFWGRVKGRKRLTRPETVREMVSKLHPNLTGQDAKICTRMIVDSLSGVAVLAEPVVEVVVQPVAIEIEAVIVEAEIEVEPEPEPVKRTRRGRRRRGASTVDGGES